MKKLVINADDFGYREGINKGIIHAHKNGVVASTSLLVEKDGTEEAVKLAKETPSLAIGPHLDLDRYFLIDHSKGMVINLVHPKSNIGDIKAEARRQVEKFLSFGFKPDHIDSHHHSHMHPDVFPLVCEVAKEFKIPIIRFVDKSCAEKEIAVSMRQAANENKLICLDHFIEGWYWGNVDEDYKIAELMTHPGYGELWRETELAHCCQQKIKKHFIDNNIKLVKFSDLIL